MKFAVFISILFVHIYVYILGMVACLLPEERDNFIGLLEALGEGNGREAAEYVINFSSRAKDIPTALVGGLPAGKKGSSMVSTDR